VPGSGLVMGGWMGGATSANARVGKRKVEIINITIDNSFSCLAILDLHDWEGKENQKKIQ
jgi:hypothetical protein